ncbi:aminoglycoside phosphotransferase family protein [bacterium]|nr:aminoglycoside phosphotransferase family protein [bacterium]
MVEPGRTSPSMVARDVESFREILTSHVLQDNDGLVEIVDIRLIYAKSSGKRGSFLYGVKFQGADSRTYEQLYVCLRLPYDRLAAEYNDLRKRAKVRPCLGRAVTLLSYASLIVLAFPNDRKIRVLSEEDLRLWLSSNLQCFNDELDERKWRVERLQVELLRYVPNKRLTRRCHASLMSRDGLEKELTFITKQFNKRKKAQVDYQNLVALREAWAQENNNGSTTPVRQMPFPWALTLDEKRAIMMFDVLPGESLEGCLDAIAVKEVMISVGGLLAKLHGTRIKVTSCVSRASEIEKMQKAVQIIIAAIPGLEVRVRALFQDLQDSFWEDGRPQVLLHGSFRLNHLFFDNGAIALLDVGSLCSGHPAYDLANFLSSLYYCEARGRITLQQRKEISRHFLYGYIEQAPWSVSRISVLWCLASLLVNKQAKKYVTHLHDDLRSKVERMLTIAETVLSECGGCRGNESLTTLHKQLP